jgi:hypothetical protein
MTEKSMTADAGTPRTLRNVAPSKLSDLHFDSIGYEFGVSVDKFDVDAFSKVFESRLKEPRMPGVELEAVLSTKDPKTSDYHVHLHWKLTKHLSQVKLRVAYIGNANKAEEGESEPFAEGAMKWLGGFFRAKDAPAHIHAAFEYPANKWKSVIPLPIRIPIGSESSNEVEVDGMSLNIKKGATGMDQAWLISREEITRVLLYGDKTVEFSNFDILKQAQMFSDYAKTFVREATHAIHKR